MEEGEGFQGAVLLSLCLIRSRLASLDSGDGDGERLVSQGLLGVLTELMHNSKKEVVVEVVEIVASLALRSSEMSLQVASNKELIESLVEHISDTDVQLASAAINAVVDLSITLAARTALQESSLIERFMFLFIWLADSLSSKLSSESESEDILLEEFFWDALEAVEMSILEHPEFTVEAVPWSLVSRTYVSLRGLWSYIHRTRKEDVPPKRNLLARFLARLGMEKISFCDLGYSKAAIIRTFMGSREHFFVRHWEQSPAIIKGGREVFEVFLKEFPVKSLSQLLDTTVGASVTCPPVASDELDPQEILKCIQSSLGGPMIYEQDIRLIKCMQGMSNPTEDHYFEGYTGSSKKVVQVEDCLKAFAMGYTVAIRGMEFRSPVVAAIAENLGLLLGQASIGANLYLTPLNSQGLAPHYDDHCVFVVQLAGQKQWCIYPPMYMLPRLYAPRVAPEVGKASPMNVLLNEGNVLYIPRGFSHQAFALSIEDKSSNDKNNRRESRSKRCSKRSHSCISSEAENAFACCSTRKVSGISAAESTNAESKFSLHLTFGVEVEPPFEWEGFIHIAFHSWFQHQEYNQAGETQAKRICKILLHYAIRGIADKTMAFRKACLVAASSKCTSTQLDACNRNGASFNPYLQETFKNLIESIVRDAQFNQAYKRMQDEIHEKGDNHVIWMYWFEHLPGSHSFDGEMLDVLKCEQLQGIDTTALEVMFRDMKANFVSQAVINEAVFVEACKVFKALLKRYRNSRRKLMHGLLALHNLHQEDLHLLFPDF